MNAVLLQEESYDLDDAARFHRIDSPRNRHERSSRSKLAARARYRRESKAAASFNGAHRRREKRNYL